MKEKNGLFSRLWDMPYGRTNPHHLFDASKNSKEFVQKLQLQIKIPVHNGCVNSICWNENGKYLLSGSDDQRLSIVHGYDYSVLAYVQTGHRANIFSAKFLPNSGDTHVVSCSGDGIIIYSNLERPETSMNNKFNCHKGTAYEIMTVPNDPNTFLSCGEDRTVRWFDVRTKTSCSNEDCKDDILINCRSPVTSLAVNPLTPYQLAVGCADASVQIYDRRMLSTPATGGTYSTNSVKALMTCFTVSEFTQSRRITSLCYSSDGQEMLVSYSSDYIYLFDIRGDLEKKPRLLSRNPSSNGSDSDSGFFFRGRPLMKRLRVRGDWSDTGPNARPEAETRSESQETSTQANIVQRMTDILTRMFNSSSQNRTRSVASQSSSGSSHVSSPSEEGDADGASDSNEDEGTGNAAEEKVKNENNKLDSSSDAGPSKPPKNSKYQRKSDKRTSSEQPSSSSAFEQEKPGPSSQDTVPEPNKSEEASKCENQSVITDVCGNTHTSDSKRTLSETFNLILEKTEENKESSNKDSTEVVSVGPTAINAPSSSSADDQQKLEQTTSESLVLPLLTQDRPVEENVLNENSEMFEAQTTEGISSESETEAAVQRIYPNDYALPVITSVRSLGSSSPLTETSGGAAESEVELMMEVDSWDVDRDQSDQSWDMERDQGAQSWSRDRDPRIQPSSHTPNQGTRRSSCDRLSDSFLCSLEDEVEPRNEDTQNDEAHVVNVSQPKVKKKFTGHRNARTMIKESTFWGDNFIMSGSDCGHIFIWDRYTAELVMLMEADHHVVNCLQPHPFDPILASSGIDYDIKLWAPLREEPFFDLEKANEIIKRNEIMLKETKDTITVPASFMFRMLALSHFRTGRAYRWSRAIREMHSANSDSST